MRDHRAIPAAERVVDLRPRTVLRVLLIVIAVAVTLEVIWIARHVLAWVVIALFLALALNPLVGWIERRSRLGRGPAIGVAYLLLPIVIVGVGASFLPKLIDEVNGFVQALPNYVDDLTHGRGRLGFLETKYHVVEKVREQVKNGGAAKVLGLSGAALSVTKSVITIIAATITIVFLTFFMLLEGGAWVERVYSLFPERSQERWRRVGHDIYRTVGGYVTGNILISLIAGSSATVVLLIMGVPYAVALGLLVAILDLIPLAGATVAGVIVVARRVPALDSCRDRARDLLHHLPAAREPLPAARHLRQDRAAVTARGPRLGAGRRRARRCDRRARGDPGRRLDPGDRARPARRQTPRSEAP